MQKSKKYGFLLILLLFILLAVLFDLLLGSVYLGFYEIVEMLTGGQGASGAHTYILEMRLHRVYAAVFAGAGLSLCGLLLQSLFRNPLAGPSVLGISSGSSFGVALLMLLFPGWVIVSGGGAMFLTFVFAIFGALAVLLVILFVGLRLRSNSAMLIAGLMLSYVLSAGVQILLQYAQNEETRSYVLWGMGSFSEIPTTQLYVMVSVVLVAAFIIFIMAKYMNGLLMGDKYAKSLGVPVKKLRLWVICITGIVTGVITAVCGPIAFVGIAVPHIVKIVCKTSDHKVLIPFTFLTGIGVCVLSDLFSSYPMVLPINAVTSLLGAPVIIWIIVRQHKHADL